MGHNNTNDSIIMHVKDHIRILKYYNLGDDRMTSGKDYYNEEATDCIIRVLRGQVEVLKSRIKPHATGHYITAIGVIETRIEELLKEKEIWAEYDEQN